MEKKIKKYMPFIQNTGANIENVRGISYFKINFKEPVIQYIPHDLEHLRTLTQSSTQEGKKITYSFIPSYIPNINHLTLRTSQDPEVSTLEIGANKDLDSFNKFTWEEKYAAMSIDTLNRFLKEYSQQQHGISNENLQQKIRMCYEFCYWNLPDLTDNGVVIFFDRGRGFGFIDRQLPDEKDLHFHESVIEGDVKKGDSVEYALGKNKKGLTATHVKKIPDNPNRSVIHNFIYDRASSIADIVVVRKTIARIDELKKSDKTFPSVYQNSIRGQLAKVTFLADDGIHIRTKTQYMYITKNASEGIEEGDLINCIISRSINKEKKGTPFFYHTIIGRVGTKIGFNLRHFLSLTAWKMFQNIDKDKSLCSMGKISNVKRNVKEMIEKIDFDMLKFVENENTLNKALDNAIEALFPLFVIKDDTLYHNPPTIISYVGIYYPRALEDREMMTDIAVLFNYFLNNYHEWGSHAQQIRMKIRTSDEFEKLQTDSKIKIDMNHFLKSTPLLANRIIYSRLYSQHWKQWLEV